MENPYTQGGRHRNAPPATKYPTIFAGRNTHVARVIVDGGLTAEEIEANCNVIAAAPRLLEALIALESAARAGEIGTEAGTKALEQAHKAIHAAFGVYE
ncbi:hypothetical protein BAE30_03895 [Acidithiobacillus caldus]|uniref:Uncharacterized protein n=1 Tax=Acidithiobacillus caldus TaxID=33059 RepID=A0A1E7YZ57_9PROT|nr:hypothetical protein BAE30_03895 [Acidithiobacillus caldus]